MMKRAAVALAFGLGAVIVSAEGWTPSTVEGKTLWTLESEARDARLRLVCSGLFGTPRLNIETDVSLFEMADPNDGEVEVFYLSDTARERNEVSGWLDSNPHRLHFDTNETHQLQRWLRKKRNHSATLTFLIQNNDRRVTYIFKNIGNVCSK